jgi:hypothetical protein
MAGYDTIEIADYFISGDGIVFLTEVDAPRAGDDQDARGHGRSPRGAA